jgi:hypothetical protein
MCVCVHVHVCVYTDSCASLHWMGSKSFDGILCQHFLGNCARMRTNYYYVIYLTLLLVAREFRGACAEEFTPNIRAQTK